MNALMESKLSLTIHNKLQDLNKRKLSIKLSGYNKNSCQIRVPVSQGSKEGHHGQEDFLSVTFHTYGSGKLSSNNIIKRVK